jgi:mono/diheme cytochrome c family protein
VMFSFAATALAPISNAAEPPPGSYRITNGKVDRGTYLGWRVFHSTCYVCHGVDALGTDVAPNLTERVKSMTPREFATKVLTRYRITVPSTEAGADDQSAYREAIIEEVMRQERGKRGEIMMPAWEQDRRVNPHVLDLYAYLSARADGELGPGRPKMIRSR